MRMYPLKGSRIRVSPKAITTLFLGTALLVGFVGMSLSFTQSAMAQEGPPEDRPENPQCPEGTIGFERGQCELPATRTVTCNPDNVAGRPAQVVTVAGEQVCQASNPISGNPSNPTDRQFRDACAGIGGVTGNTGGKDPQRTCTFDVTEEIDCPGDIVPTEEGQCFTRPGRGNDPTD